MLFLVFISSVLCEEIAIRLSQHITPEQFATIHGLEYVHQIANLSQYYLFSTTENSLHANFKRSNAIEWAESQFPRQLAKRSIMDPLYEQQWHLHASIAGISVEGAWDRGYSGKGVVISILDDGVEKEHPDLQSKYRDDLSYDINNRIRGIIALTFSRSALGIDGHAWNSGCWVGSSEFEFNLWNWN
jgi:subtilisin family serine protease